MYFNLDKLNESLDKQYCNDKEELQEAPKHFDLLMALKKARQTLERDGANNIKQYEVAYQDVIEKYFPEKSWWEVVDFDIFNDLFQHRNPEHTEIEIIKHINDDVDEGLGTVLLGAATAGLAGGAAAGLGKKLMGEEKEECEDQMNELLNGNTIQINPNVNTTLDPQVKADVHDVTTGDIASANTKIKPTELKEKFEKGFKFNNANFEWEVLDTNGDYTLVFAKDKKFHPYVVAWLLSKNRDDDEYSWSQGHYFMNKEDAEDFLASVRNDESLKEKNCDEALKVTKEVDLKDFDFRPEAKNTVKYLTDDQLIQVQYALEDMYPEGMTETQLNEFFWFEDDTIAQMLGFEDFDELIDANKR